MNNVNTTMLTTTSIISFLKKTLIAATIITSVQSLAAAPLDKIIAIVNDEIILESDFNENIKQALQQIKQQKAQAPSQQVLQSQIMEQMILRTIILKMAKTQGIRVTDRELNETVTQIAKSNGMTLERFRKALNAQGQDYISTREKIREDLLIQKAQESNINRRIQISDHEINNFLRSQASNDNAEVLLSDILIAINSPMTPQNIKDAKTKADEIYQLIQSGETFTNVAISHSSAANALNGGDMGWKKIAELPISLANAISPLTPGQISQPTRTPTGFHILQLRDTRNGIKAVKIEKTKVRHILISPNEVTTKSQAKRISSQLYQRLLKQPGSFAEIAQEYSNDPGSSSQGGDLGWTQSGQMVPEFEKVMSSTQINQISLPFESRFGWHILQVTDRRAENVTNRAQENFARNVISKRKFNEERDNWLREIRADAYVEFK